MRVKKHFSNQSSASCHILSQQKSLKIPKGLIKSIRRDIRAAIEWRHNIIHSLNRTTVADISKYMRSTFIYYDANCSH